MVAASRKLKHGEVSELQLAPTLCVGARHLTLRVVFALDAERRILVPKLELGNENTRLNERLAAPLACGTFFDGLLTVAYSANTVLLA